MGGGVQAYKLGRVAPAPDLGTVHEDALVAAKAVEYRGGLAGVGHRVVSHVQAAEVVNVLSNVRRPLAEDRSQQPH